MRVLFVVDGGADDPGTRARVLALLPALRGLGVEPRVLGPGPARKWHLLPAARAADVVVLQRVLPPPALLRMLRRASRALVLDFDDALATLPDLRPRFEAAVAAADVVVAGSEELARSAAGALVVPTVVDPAAYGPAGWRTGGLRRVGWIGTPQNLPYLDVLRPVLAGRDDLVLRVISSTAPAWPDVRIEHVPWWLDTAAAALAQLDAGLAPLPDTRWTRGKCGYKALEYMASGVPVVASPVGSLASIVVDGETGLHATDAAGWSAALDRLDDPQLRMRMGTAGRERVRERYSVEVAAPLVVDALERAVSVSKSRT
jgi:glycosyltransferase involved in cell wall biosynthesis